MAGGRRDADQRALASSRVDHAGVEAGQVQAAVEPGVLDLQAAVHHHLEPRGLGRAATVSSNRPNCSQNVFAPDAPAPRRAPTAGRRGGGTRRPDRAPPAARPATGTPAVPRISVRVRVDEVHVVVGAGQQVGGARSCWPAPGSATRRPSPRCGSRAGSAAAASRRRGSPSVRSLTIVLRRPRSSAWSRSHRMSSASSMPTLMRTRSGGTPAAAQLLVGELLVGGASRGGSPACGRRRCWPGGCTAAPTR